MRISPLDVRSQDFRKSLRGYDPEEVKAFLDAIADTMEGLLKEKEAVERELAALKKRLGTYNEMETSLRDAMMAAQRAGDEAKLNARRNSELMIREAELEVRQMIADAKRRVDDIFRARDTVKAEMRVFLPRLRSLLQSQLGFIKSMEEELKREGLLDDSAESDLDRIAPEPGPTGSAKSTDRSRPHERRPGASPPETGTHDVESRPPAGAPGGEHGEPAAPDSPQVQAQGLSGAVARQAGQVNTETEPRPQTRTDGEPQAHAGQQTGTETQAYPEPQTGAESQALSEVQARAAALNEQAAALDAQAAEAAARTVETIAKAADGAEGAPELAEGSASEAEGTPLHPTESQAIAEGAREPAADRGAAHDGTRGPATDPAQSHQTIWEPATDSVESAPPGNDSQPQIIREDSKEAEGVPEEHR